MEINVEKYCVMQKYKNISKNVLTNRGRIDIIKSTKRKKSKSAREEEKAQKKI